MLFMNQSCSTLQRAKKRSPIVILIITISVIGVVIANNGVIVKIADTQLNIAPTPPPPFNTSNWAKYHWEPHTVAGATWATSYTLQSFGAGNVRSYVTTWNSSTSSWRTPIEMIVPNDSPHNPGQTTGDLYLEWDAFRSKFALVAVNLPVLGQHSVHIWYSNDSQGASWTYKGAALVGTDQRDWDYPSVGIDTQGRIIVGATGFTSGNIVDGFFTTISIDGGMNWSPAVEINPQGVQAGYHSRVVAAGNKFHAFNMYHDGNFNPSGFDRFESTDGANWSFGSNLGGFASFNRSPGRYSSNCTSPVDPGFPDGPCNCSYPTSCSVPSVNCAKIGYAPAIDARGSTNGNWIVGVPVNNNGYNNIYICTSDRGCGFVNAAADDQFTFGVAVAPQAGGGTGYWISYLTYSTLTTRRLPLIAQSIYFPPNQPAIGGTIYNNIDARKWWRECPGGICGTELCYIMGDYSGVAANAYAAASFPYVLGATPTTALWQTFAQDPQGQSNIPNFRPNFIPYPLGFDLKALSGRVSDEVMRTQPPSQKRQETRIC
jgi:hypothetical protein